MTNISSTVNDAQKRVSKVLTGARKDARERARPTVEMQTRAQSGATQALDQAERTPDMIYLGAVFASMAISLMLMMRKQRSASLFLGLWPVTILNIAMMLKYRRPSKEVADFEPFGNGQ